MSNLEDMIVMNKERLISTLKEKDVLTSLSIEEAFRFVPRHGFLNKLYVLDKKNIADRILWQTLERPDKKDIAAFATWLELAYTDDALVTAIDDNGFPTSSSTAPWLMCLMLESLQIYSGLRVLEIGTGTGYNMALLIHLISDSNKVFSIEIDQKLAEVAEKNIANVLGTKAMVSIGNGLNGHVQEAPYDRIIATGGYHKIPTSWLDQLREDGILVMNLRKELFGGILYLKKLGKKRTAIGHFLPSSATFVNLKDPNPTMSSSSLSDTSYYSQYPPVLKKKVLTEELDVVNMWNSSFRVYLQLEMPNITLFSLSKERIDTFFEPKNFITVVIDPITQTMISLSYEKQKDTWVVEVKGDQKTWEKLTSVYQRWMELGSPQLADYIADIDDEGVQTMRISSVPAGSSPPIWYL